MSIIVITNNTRYNHYKFDIDTILNETIASEF